MPVTTGRVILSKNAHLIMLLQGLPFASRVHVKLLGLLCKFLHDLALVYPSSLIKYLASFSASFLVMLLYSSQYKHTCFIFFPPKTVPSHSDFIHLVNIPTHLLNKQIPVWNFTSAGRISHSHLCALPIPLHICFPKLRRVPKTALWFDNSPEGLTHSLKTVLLTVTVYHSEMKQI